MSRAQIFPLSRLSSVGAFQSFPLSPLSSVGAFQTFPLSPLSSVTALVCSSGQSVISWRHNDVLELVQGSGGGGSSGVTFNLCVPLELSTHPDGCSVFYLVHTSLPPAHSRRCERIAFLGRVVRLTSERGNQETVDRAWLHYEFVFYQ